VLYLKTLDGLEDLQKRDQGDRNDHPEEISDQQPEHHQEGNRGQHTCSASFGERRPFRSSRHAPELISHHAPQLISHHAPELVSHHAPELVSHHAPQRAGVSRV